ncbi:MAG TPA: methylmalonyl Co-A mutase-associated GTPase MeaB [Acidimicrobiales bacterium]|nr:methylmalonyl Co-A mutase-associated GTPase MeaB [Acidimicrobiales bacterium]
MATDAFDGEEPAAWATRIVAGDRRALARAITLTESTRPDHRLAAETLLNELIPSTGAALRLGISGAPGAGKSTFIEAFGLHQIERGHRVAVLAVDPSSRRSGGSILGDKTRMERLVRNEAAFIRPSPAGTTLGGIARRSREVLLLCEAAGFDLVLVETVGVGQSELAVADMTDLFVLLVSPGTGDELQGIKRGIMELADLVVVTKADGDLAGAARHSVADHKRALQLLRPPHPGIDPTALGVSSTLVEGIAEVADRIDDAHRTLRDSGEQDRQRARQRRDWLWTEITEGIRSRILTDPELGRALAEAERAVAAGEESPVTAARRLLEDLRPSAAPDPSVPNR